MSVWKIEIQSPKTESLLMQFLQKFDDVAVSPFREDETDETDHFLETGMTREEMSALLEEREREVENGHFITHDEFNLWLREWQKKNLAR